MLLYSAQSQSVIWRQRERGSAVPNFRRAMRKNGTKSINRKKLVKLMCVYYCFVTEFSIWCGDLTKNLGWDKKTLLESSRNFDFCCFSCVMPRNFTSAKCSRASRRSRNLWNHLFKNVTQILRHLQCNFKILNNEWFIYAATFLFHNILQKYQSRFENAVFWWVSR